MAVDHLDIYRNQAQQYERLVAREDYQGNIWKTLQEICGWQDQVVLDLGAGTGRLSEIVLPQAKFVWSFDRSPAMLQVAREKQVNGRSGKWAVTLADHRHLPVAENSANRIISGWSLAYLALDKGPRWRAEIGATFERMFKILRPAGRIIILETMGTGYTEPAPPGILADYYSFLDDLGFHSTWIRTDYQFAFVEEAVELTRFFFGAELATEVAQKQWQILPECTGVWWK